MRAIWVYAVGGVAYFLSAHAILKLAAVINAFRWTSKNAISYSRLYQIRKPTSINEQLALLRSQHADFFPFGAKDLKLVSFYTSPSETKLGRIVRYCVKSWSSTLSENFRLSWISITFLTIVVLAGPLSDTVTNVGLLCLSMTVLFLRVLMTYEACFWYVSIKRYSGIYLSRKQRFDSPESDERTSRLRDLRTSMTRIVSSSIASCIVACGVAQLIVPPTFKGINSGDGWANGFHRLVESVYFVFTTMLTVGYGDIVPETDFGRLLVILIMINGFLTIGVLLAYFIGSALIDNKS